MDDHRGWSLPLWRRASSPARCLSDGEVLEAKAILLVAGGVAVPPDRGGRAVCRGWGVDASCDGDAVDRGDLGKQPVQVVLPAPGGQPEQHRMVGACLLQQPLIRVQLADQAGKRLAAGVVLQPEPDAAP